MQFTIAITALFAVAASAASIDTSMIAREADALNTLQTQAQAFIVAKTASGCDKLKCITALAPTVVSCAAAAAELGANAIADAACIATLGNTAINRPAQCKGC